MTIKKVVWLTLAASLGCVLVITITIRVKARVWSNPVLEANRPQQLLVVTSGSVQIVRFTVYDAGIFPREARVSADRVAIQFEDLTGDSGGLFIRNERSEMVGQVVRSPNRWRGSTRVTLAPGRYQVYDSSRPANQATLIVQR